MKTRPAPKSRRKISPPTRAPQPSLKAASNLSSSRRAEAKFYDITPLISEKLAVFPGDVPFERNISMDFSSGQHLRLSSIKTTLHLGAHADSSGHYHQQGQGIEQRRLGDYLGKCQVIRVKIDRGQRIGLSHLKNKKIKARRVLFHTGSFPDPYSWNSDFCALSPELINFLHSQGVRLVGIDTPSVDPESSKKLESHQALYQCGMSVLEGLLLAAVPEGEYFLSALPLAIANADAGPVRAVLVRMTEFQKLKS